MRLAGLLLLLVMVYVGLAEDRSAMFDPASALIVVGSTLGMLLMSFGKSWGAGFRALRRKEASREEIELGQATLYRLKSMIVVSGVLGSLIGVMLMTVNMDDASWIGAGMAILLLCQVYSLLLAFGVVQPLAASLASRLEDLEG